MLHWLLLLLLLRCCLQVVGKLAGNSNASISSLLAIPSKAGAKAPSGQATGPAAPAAGATGAGPRPPTGAANVPAAAGGTGGIFAGVTGSTPYYASRDFLVGGDSTGNMFVWEPFSFPLPGPDVEMAPRIARTAHKAEIWSLCLVPGAEDAVRTEPRVYSAGEGALKGERVGDISPGHMCRIEMVACRSGAVCVAD
jgi:hypothetical protein